jgi:hypothetical protein
MCPRNRRSQRRYENFPEFLRCNAEICYSSNNFQDSTKRKSTEKKTLGYLPRVLFFNAFELGAESGNQVFSNEALRSIAEVFSTRHFIVSK